jgi:hypothetical protein
MRTITAKRGFDGGRLMTRCESGLGIARMLDFKGVMDQRGLVNRSGAGVTRTSISDVRPASFRH